MFAEHCSIKVVIPARYESQRLPGKPLLEINGMPMFWHVAQRVLESGISINDLIIATDDSRIYERARALCLPVMMTSSDHESGTERSNEVARRLNWSDDTLIMNVQGDEPLVPPDLLKELVTFSQSNTQFDIFSAYSGIKSVEDFLDRNIVKVVISDSNSALLFSRSAIPLNRERFDDIALAYMHIGLYMYRAGVLSKLCSLSPSKLEKYEKLEQLRALSNGFSIGMLNYKGNVFHGVDTYDDYIKTKKLMEKIK